MSATKMMVAIVLAAALAVPMWAQGNKGGGGGSKPKCVNLSAVASLETLGSANQLTRISPLGASEYDATLLNCAGETGDAQLVADGTRNPGHPMTRDFSARIPVPVEDDDLPGFLADQNQTEQSGNGAIHIRAIVKGYDAATGYAPGFPVSACWAGGNDPNVHGCTFTSSAIVNFRASDNINYQLYLRNPDADTIPTEWRNGNDKNIDELLNAEYRHSFIRVTFAPGIVRLDDTWEAEPIAAGSDQGLAAGKSVASLWAFLKRGIIRYGYFDMHFKMSIRRVD
jgi:hypothetical protein